jgi:hypothetical protein
LRNSWRLEATTTETGRKLRGRTACVLPLLNFAVRNRYLLD